MLVLIAVIAVSFCLTLTACDKVKNPEVKKDVIVYLNEILTDFNNKNTLSLSGKITTDTEKTVTAAYDKKDMILDYTYGADSYHYADSTLFFRKENGYVIKETDVTFTKAMKAIPFNLSQYKYDADHVYAVDYDGDNVVISFYKHGVARSFNTDLEVTGGSFTIIIEDGTIKSTVLSTVITDNGKKKNYVAEYAYSDGEPIRNVAVAPSDDLNYATYAINAIDAHNQGKTIHTLTQNQDRGVTIKSIPLTPASITNVFCIKTANYVTVNIVYASPVLIEMVHSSVETVKITFDENYTDVQIVINDGNHYHLA